MCSVLSIGRFTHECAVYSIYTRDDGYLRSTRTESNWGDEVCKIKQKQQQQKMLKINLWWMIFSYMEMEWPTTCDLILRQNFVFFFLFRERNEIKLKYINSFREMSMMQMILSFSGD